MTFEDSQCVAACEALARPPAWPLGTQQHICRGGGPQAGAQGPQTTGSAPSDAAERRTVTVKGGPEGARGHQHRLALRPPWSCVSESAVRLVGGTSCLQTSWLPWKHRKVLTRPVMDTPPWVSARGRPADVCPGVPPGSSSPVLTRLSALAHPRPVLPRARGGPCNHCG